MITVALVQPSVFEMGESFVKSGPLTPDEMSLVFVHFTDALTRSGVRVTGGQVTDVGPRKVVIFVDTLGQRFELTIRQIVRRSKKGE